MTISVAHVESGQTFFSGVLNPLWDSWAPPTSWASSRIAPNTGTGGVIQTSTTETSFGSGGPNSGTVQPMSAVPTTPDPSPADLLDELVRDHLDSVYRVAYSVVRDAALAEDVAQDAILKAWRALPTFRGESSLRSWVLRITHNTAISTLRKRREEIRDPNLLPEQESHSTTEQQVVGRLSIGAFEDALNQLDELSRSIVVLREIEGMSYDEISSMLDVPLPTVKTRLLRSRRILAVALEDWRP